jgi:hypothetical protein
MAPGEFSGLLHAIRTKEALLVKRQPRRRAIYAYRLPTAKKIIYVLASKDVPYTAWPPSGKMNALRKLARDQKSLRDAINERVQAQI